MKKFSAVFFLVFYFSLLSFPQNQIEQNESSESENSESTDSKSKSIESESAKKIKPTEKIESGEPIEISESDFVRLSSIKYVSPKGDENLKKANEIFSQYQKDIEKSSRLKHIPENRRKESDFPAADFYVYKIPEDSDEYLSSFTGLSARLQISQGTLATVNSISSPSVKKGADLILPVNQGLFIAKNPSSPLEVLLKNEYSSQILQNEENPVPQFKIRGRIFYFLQDKNFSGTDIAFFHDDSMQLPLSKKILTSPFGYRTSPISGKWTFHAGIDMAAPLGTEVFACKSGVVSQTGFNSTYGNFIIILHNKNKTSLYAHLSKIISKKGDRVSTGQTIGLVGTTGASTGPHLHFEVRENGNPLDPGKLLKN